MKRKRKIMFVLFAAVAFGCLGGCGKTAESTELFMAEAADSAIEQEMSDFSMPAGTGAGVSMAVTCDEKLLREKYKEYEQYGMIYDADKKELLYHDKTVRWFEDYYPIGIGMRAGVDYFNEKGTVDVYAVRDLDAVVYAADGSFDPSGKLLGLKEFSEEEFAARDIEEIKKQEQEQISVAVSDEPLSADAMEQMKEEYAEYEKYGLTYHVSEDSWYYKGDKVRYFQDVLTSNGKDLKDAGFSGSIRRVVKEDGITDIRTVRNYGKTNAFGYGSLVGIERCNGSVF